MTNTFRPARDLAIGEGRQMDLVFIAPNQINLLRDEINAPVGTIVSCLS